MSSNRFPDGGLAPAVLAVNGHGAPVGLPLAGTEPAPAPSAPPRPVEAVLAAIVPATPERAVQELVERLRVRGVSAAVYDVGPGVIALTGVSVEAAWDLLGDEAVVERWCVAEVPYRLAWREVWRAGSVVEIGGVAFGGAAFGVIAGPCAVESRAQILAAARAAAGAGAGVLRGGAFKPRTSPYAFQGLGMQGVSLLAEARAATGLPFITEVVDAAHVEAMYPWVDAFQVGARNMQNFELLRALGDVDKPVLLKRAPGATLEEWLLAAEYLLAGGNGKVMLCERGIRTFNTRTRYTLDLATMALAKRETHLPVIVDPSHATGDPGLVGPMALAAMAAGADGVIVEMHPSPRDALSDAAQALHPDELAVLVAQLRTLAPAVGRTMDGPPDHGAES